MPESGPAGNLTLISAHVGVGFMRVPLFLKTGFVCIGSLPVGRRSQPMVSEPSHYGHPKDRFSVSSNSEFQRGNLSSWLGVL